ncbi:hypothetical protein QBC43DRAFT_303972 [Cladorrhinum sp. PSN259]|nr:hypothetical protein QBC43DRAFT_303972 [Cladorrhinum sp. PSN259]
MSGFEIVGVVLGSVPLLISGLEHYRNGIETIQTMAQYVVVLREIVDSIETAITIYKQQCEILLKPLLLPDSQLGKLLGDGESSQDAWKDLNLAKQLKEKFGSTDERDKFLKAVHRLHQRILKLKSKLGLKENFEPSWMDDGEVNGDALARFFSQGRKILRAIKVGFQDKKYLEMASRIDKEVRDIERLVGNARTLEPIRAEWSTKQAARHWLGVRDRARQLFSVLSSHWSSHCACTAKHVASIKLDKCEDFRLEALSDGKTPFRLLFTFEIHTGQSCRAPWEWRAVEIVPVSDSSPQIAGPVLILPPAQHLLSPTIADPGPITNLCDSLLQVKVPLQALGFIGDNGWCHHVAISTPWQSFEHERCFTSLSQTLQSLGTKQKHRLAATLASAVLQYHSTPWLDPQWDLHEITVLKDAKNRINFDQPYVSRRFTAQHSSKRVPWHFAHNKILFALGIALLEISYGRCLSELQEEEDRIEGLHPLLATADRLTLELGKREHQKYHDAVDRCIRCRFETTSRDLENAELLALFYQGVVMPLQELCEIK